MEKNESYSLQHDNVPNDYYDEEDEDYVDDDDDEEDYDDDEEYENAVDDSYETTNDARLSQITFTVNNIFLFTLYILLFYISNACTHCVSRSFSFYSYETGGFDRDDFTRLLFTVSQLDKSGLITPEQKVIHVSHLMPL